MTSEIELLLRVIDEHKEESKRRHDKTDKDLSEIKSSLNTLQKSRAKFDGIVLGISLLGGAIVTTAFEVARILFRA